MKQIDLLNTPQARLVVEDNVAAIVSDVGFLTVSSAIYNGGLKRVKAILNIQVPEGYSDLQLHEDPLHLVKISSQKVGVSEDFLAMITAAKIKNMMHIAKTEDGITVNVVATAGASHGESAGEPINATVSPTVEPVAQVAYPPPEMPKPSPSSEPSPSESVMLLTGSPRAWSSRVPWSCSSRSWHSYSYSRDHESAAC